MFKSDITEFDTRHGSPWDRGTADSYYGRPRDPHWYPEGTGNGERIGRLHMSDAELDAYRAGYNWNELHGDRKEWI